MSLNLRHKNLQIHTEPSHIQKNSTVTNKTTTKTKTQNLHKCTQNPHKETWNYHGSFSSCRWRTSWKGWITKTSQDDRDKLPQEPEAAGNVSICHLYFTRGIKSGWYLQRTDGRCSNNQTSGEQGSATKHKGSVWVEELAAEDVAAAGPRVGRRFPELNPGFPSSFCGQTFLDASPSGLCGLRLHLLRDTDCVLLFKPISQQLLQRSNRKRPDWKHDWKDKKEQR